MKLLRFAILATLLIPFNNAWSATLTESPANVVQGGAATVTWSAVAAPTNTDWIGLYVPLGADTAYLDWLYVNSCSKSAGASVLAAGSCNFLIPNSLANGTYQFRLFAANGYSRLATASFSIAPVAPPSTRFVDNGDGTISDTQTGLMWEKKTGTASSPLNPVNCSTLPACPDPHNVNNAYFWTSSGTAPDGPLFTNFLTRINTELSTSADGSTVADVCFAGHCDWRIPNIAELQTIVVKNCNVGPCIDPIFGPTLGIFYWSSTTVAGNPNSAWLSWFAGQSILGGGPFANGPNSKTSTINAARAVRGDR